MSNVLLDEVRNCLPRKKDIQSWDEVAQYFALQMIEKGEWAGVPMALPDQRLIIEPKYPYQELKKFGKQVEPVTQEDLDVIGIRLDERQVNEWSTTHKCIRGVYKTVIVCHYTGEDGKKRAKHYTLYNADMMKRLTAIINTVGCSEVWNTEAELTALNKLAGMIGWHRYRQYVLTGSFLETSQRSGVKYIFRRNRPTIACGSTRNGMVRVLACLCLHPIAYYDQTYAGTMVPTDDVISHLLLMRGDEHMFWKRANHHRAEDWTSGI